jgi:fructokinase
MSARVPPSPLRLGIDLGGTKIAGVMLGPGGRLIAEHRRPAPRGEYGATLGAISDVVGLLEHQVGAKGTLGIGIPGSVVPSSGLVQNANSTWINGKPLGRDLETALGRPVRIANDANCFALSEAFDGAGKGARCVFGAILGTGCGGGLVVDGALVDGPRGIAGEWGHNSLPWAEPEEHPGPRCWCGRRGCIEAFVSGPALAADHQRATGRRLSAEAVAAAAGRGEAAASATLARHASRLARGLAGIVNILDPDVIVLGGGLSKLEHLYRRLPALMRPHILGAVQEVDIRPPAWGDASGVRGAAWLWGRP